MSRPKAQVLLEHINPDASAVQICVADAVYAVCYQGKPIKLKTWINIEVGYPGPKYGRTMFPEPAHAFNLADRLNQRFDTDEFTVMILTTEKTVKRA